ncbi:hypothetical protein NM688_g5777 [Phlebia brevispora]|uniref:Uncharacterized protein n=1 Tax=Phlebia brevispora TaxID=194682 RepID=A0ACC1SQ02_9APHY|nr:hypothetical protein NM688_g5777 [Phlebia brevispora]
MIGCMILLYLYKERQSGQVGEVPGLRSAPRVSKLASLETAGKHIKRLLPALVLLSALLQACQLASAFNAASWQAACRHSSLPSITRAQLRTIGLDTVMPLFRDFAQGFEIDTMSQLTMYKDKKLPLDIGGDRCAEDACLKVYFYKQGPRGPVLNTQVKPKILFVMSSKTHEALMYHVTGGKVVSGDEESNIDPANNLSVQSVIHRWRAEVQVERPFNQPHKRKAASPISDASKTRKTKTWHFEQKHLAEEHRAEPEDEEALDYTDPRPADQSKVYAEPTDLGVAQGEDDEAEEYTVPSPEFIQNLIAKQAEVRGMATLLAREHVSEMKIYRIPHLRLRDLPEDFNFIASLNNAKSTVSAFILAKVNVEYGTMVAPKGAFKTCHDASIHPFTHGANEVLRDIFGDGDVVAKRCYHTPLPGDSSESSSKKLKRYDSVTYELSLMLDEGNCHCFGIALMLEVDSYVNYRDEERKITGPVSGEVLERPNISKKMPRGVILLEEKIQGHFLKYVKNTKATPCEDLVTAEDLKIAEYLCFTQHAQYILTNGTMYVSDYQGCGELLTDCQILTSVDFESCFGNGNLLSSFEMFEQDHECNKWCRYYNLEPFENAKVNNNRDELDNKVDELDEALEQRDEVQQSEAGEHYSSMEAEDDRAKED